MYCKNLFQSLEFAINEERFINESYEFLDIILTYT